MTSVIKNLAAKALAISLAIGFNVPATPLAPPAAFAADDSVRETDKVTNKALDKATSSTELPVPTTTREVCSRCKFMQKGRDAYKTENYFEAFSNFQIACGRKELGTYGRAIAEISAAAAAYQVSHIHLARHHYENAAKYFEDSKIEDPKLRAELYCSLADVNYELCKYEKAIDYYEQALNMVRHKDGSSDSYHIFMRCLDGIAACHFRNKEVAKSLPIYQEIAWRDRHTYGPLSTQYGWSLRILSDVYDALNDKARAKACFDRSVWNFRLADRDRLVRELQGKSKWSSTELAARLTERTIGIGTVQPEPDDIKPAYTGAKDLPEAFTPTSKAGQQADYPWHRLRTVLNQPAAIQWVNPDVDTHGIVVCVPGFGLHRSSFSALGQGLAKEGFIVYAYDVRGFGAYTSVKARDRIDLEKTLDDLEQSLKAIRHDNPNIPVFILGESMGGSIALQFTAKHPELVDGLIAAVPSSKRYRQWSLTSKVGLSMLLRSKEPIDTTGNVLQRATTDGELQKRWLEDPESRFTATPGEFLAVSKFLSRNKASAERITKTPVMMYQGVHDLLIKPEGTISLFRRIGSDDKDLSLIGRSQHLLFEQGQFSENLLETLSDWLKDHSHKVDPKTISSSQS